LAIVDTKHDSNMYVSVEVGVEYPQDDRYDDQPLVISRRRPTKPSAPAGAA